MGELSGLDIYYIFGTSIPLIAFLGGLTIKFWRKFKKKREDVEKAFNREMELYRASGSTVSARTDLGFFVILELESLRDNLNLNRHFLIFLFFFFLVLGYFFIVQRAQFHFEIIFYLNIGDLSEVKENLFKDMRYILRLFFVMEICTIVLMGVVLRLIFNQQDYISKYEKRVKDIWAQPINKRSKTSYEKIEI